MWSLLLTVQSMKVFIHLSTPPLSDIYLRYDTIFYSLSGGGTTKIGTFDFFNTPLMVFPT